MDFIKTNWFAVLAALASMSDIFMWTIDRHEAWLATAAAWTIIAISTYIYDRRIEVLKRLIELQQEEIDCLALNLRRARTEVRP